MLAVDGSPEGIARLRKSVPPTDRERLSTRVAPFSEVELPTSDLVYAGLSLPFCDPREFDEVWRPVTSAIRPDRLFAGHFFGPHDTWSGTPDMNFHTRAEIEALLGDFEVVGFREQDEDGEAVSGPKHWHVFHVIAGKRS